MWLDQGFLHNGGAYVYQRVLIVLFCSLTCNLCNTMSEHTVSACVLTALPSQKTKASLQGITGLRHIPVFSGTSVSSYCVTASGVILTLTALTGSKWVYGTCCALTPC